jgi:hypothetical protein
VPAVIVGIGAVTAWKVLAAVGIIVCIAVFFVAVGPGSRSDDS